MLLQLHVEHFKEKVQGKVGEFIYDSQRCKSFLGPEAGPGPQLIGRLA